MHALPVLLWLDAWAMVLLVCVEECVVVAVKE
jgi:hypothetical protein